MKNYIISDIHFSKTKEFKSISDPMDEFIDVVKKDNNEKRIIIGGDYFDHLFSTGDDEYKKAINYLKKMMMLCDEMIVLYGTQSHDRSNYVPILKFLPSHVHFCDRAEVFESKLNDEKILLLPEEYPADFAGYYKEFFDVSDKEYSLLIGHGNILGAKMNEYVTIDNRRLGNRTFNKEDLSRVAKQSFFGHIHLRQALTDNVDYIGSMNKTGFGEEFEKKGYWVYNSANMEKIFCELKSVWKFVDISWGEFKQVEVDAESTIINYRILIDAETSETVKKEIRDLGLKMKRGDMTASQLAEEKNESKLKYDGLDSKASIEDQYMLAFEADKKNTKKIKSYILDEMKNSLFVQY